jgi:polyhydroxyalkanoate synthase
VVSSAEFASKFQEEAQKNMERVQTLVDSFVVNPADPPMALTHREVIWKRGKARLFRYHSTDTPVAYRTPYLIVPWLGISRPYVLDLMPGASMIEFLVDHGHDVYLLDWGEIAEEDKELGFEEAVFKILPRAIDRVMDASGANDITLNGLCLGGTISSCYLGLNPDAPVRNFIAIVSPINFEEGGLFRTWLNDPHFPADLILERYNGLPSSLMNTGFKMLRPTLEAQALSGLWANVNRPGYIDGYKAMSRWANDFIGMPGRFFTQLSKDLYANNRLLNGDFTLNGRRVNLERITQPLLVAAATQDFIVPSPAARSLMDAVSSEDKEYIELPGGHISVFSGRQAHQTLWPKIDEWVSARSG